jgi:hypothetical protein
MRRVSQVAVGACDLPTPAREVRWATQGVRDGLDDYYATHPGALESATVN